LPTWIDEKRTMLDAMHIIAGVFINDDKSGRHADAHLKRTVVGREIVDAVMADKLDFGP
jgi:hypothetical protein